MALLGVINTILAFGSHPKVSQTVGGVQLWFFYILLSLLRVEEHFYLF